MQGRSIGVEKIKKKYQLEPEPKPENPQYINIKTECPVGEQRDSPALCTEQSTFLDFAGRPTWFTHNNFTGVGKPTALQLQLALFLRYHN